MPIPVEESQFERTKMSFGQHLEELRRAVFKSLLALAVGVAVGLGFGWQIVDYVQTPLRASLGRFYQRQAQHRQLRRLEEMKTLGRDVPADLPMAAAQMAEEGLVPLEFYVSPRELGETLAERFPAAAAQLKAEQIEPDIPVETTGVANSATADKAANQAMPSAPRYFPPRDQLIRLPAYQALEDDSRLRLTGLGAEEPFMIYLKAGLVAGFVLASPFIFYFLWEFVAAGLYGHEKSYVHTYLPVSLGLFLGGAVLAFFVVFAYVLDFLLGYYEWTGTEPGLRLSEWMTLVLLMPLAFGISFQLPLGMLALERIGIFSVESYWSKWRISVVVIAVAAMILSPGGDPYSMLLMFVPMVGLYFGGIAMCRYMPGAKRTGARTAPPSETAGS